MRIIEGRNVQSIFPLALEELRMLGVRRDSRNGPVIMMGSPVSTVYHRPEERVLFHPWRDANPFFHFFEALWMLAGRNDVAPLARYASRMQTYSDDGTTQNAAYGYRWRHSRSFGRQDQLAVIIEGLQKNHDCRRQVLQIWDAVYDLGTATKDAACNVAATFQINDRDELDMVVFCRSNDIIWGCYGANVVHFSTLQEYIARSIGIYVGSYTQISVNWHAYVDVYEKTLDKIESAAALHTRIDPYESDVAPFPLMSTTRAEWDRDLAVFVSSDGRLPNVKNPRCFVDPFFNVVAWPIVEAHDIWKDTGDYEAAIAAIARCQASDWRRACAEWLTRRAAGRSK